MIKEPKVTIKLALQHGLTKKEYQQIRDILRRTPTFTELGLFSVLWSEHCSYKNSKPILKMFLIKAPWVLQGPGENAGIVDIGDDLAVVMKIESHNHPSAIEPYQGAATGIGGILRDIFTMGARPVALLDPLYFGNLQDPKVRYLFAGVVSGIGDYGNCVGIPTIGGCVYFDSAYTTNPLVNVMCVGIAKHKMITKGIAKGKGNLIVAFGNRTGRDGIHGCTFASEELSEESEKKRPSVQIGDPFTKKLLLEASLEMIEAELVIGMQDMGAAGLTSSTIEMAGRGKSGIELNLEKVPLREEGMIPYEIMLSESQERMVVVIRPKNFSAVKKICDKWELNCAIIGKVTDDRKVKVKRDGKVYAEVPVKALVDEAPVYQRKGKEPAYLKEIRNFDFSSLPEPSNYNEVLLRLLSSPTIANKEWVFRQYDHQVRTNTIILPGSDAAILRIRGTNKAIALTADCNGRYCYLNPRKGGALAVCEAARNLVCSGANPLGITDCLNFGNPNKTSVIWQFKSVVEGMSEACRALNIPVISGNVSFYNESQTHSVYPTPVVGMVGLIENLSYVTTPWFKDEGDVIILIGETISPAPSLSPALGGSEYLKVIHDLVKGDAPSLDLKLEKRVQKTCLEAIQKGIIKSAHDISEGGLACALAECCIMNKRKMLGANIDMLSDDRFDFLLFSELQSSIILSLEEKHLSLFKKLTSENKVSYKILGRVGGERLTVVRSEVGQASRLSMIDLEVKTLSDKWRQAIEVLLKG
ncbi:MAG: phosphoribosylformylglycinamidine synthase subunit PurL [Candidatus Edwardsbacteria bacterium]